LEELRLGAAQIHFLLGGVLPASDGLIASEMFLMFLFQHSKKSDSAGDVASLWRTKPTPSNLEPVSPNCGILLTAWQYLYTDYKWWMYHVQYIRVHRVKKKNLERERTKEGPRNT